MNRIYTFTRSLTLGLLLNIPPTTEAFTPPEWADQENAHYAEWRHFSEGFGRSGNLPDIPDSNLAGTLFQHLPGGIVTGSGNIYNPAAASEFSLQHSSAESIEGISLQTEIIGDIAPASVVLEYMMHGETQSVVADGGETSRVQGGFGDSVTNQWTWDLSDLNITNVTLRWKATSSHSSLVSVRLDTLTSVSTEAEVYQMSSIEPSDDRWNYRFNVTPGSRAKASVFRSTEPEIGVTRHGNFILGFETVDYIPAGYLTERYEIVSAQLRLLTSDNFETTYDPTLDSVFTYLPDDHQSYRIDGDAGRPVELFGAGFRGGFALDTWTEAAPYLDEETENPIAFPATFNFEGTREDVSLGVDYADPQELAPFAIGELDGVSAGDLIPSDHWMHFDVDLTNPTTQAYLQAGLSAGKLWFTVTSLGGGGQGARVFPEFHTKDSLVGEAPQLSMEVRIVESRGQVNSLEITLIESIDSGIKLHFRNSGAEPVGIRWTSDFKTWTSVENPILEVAETDITTWTDETVDSVARFYQIFLRR